MTPEKEVQRGEQAKNILNDPLYREALEVIRLEIQHRWETSPASDAAGRETLWLSLKLLSRLEQHMQSVMESGKLAKAKLTQRIGPKRLPI